MARQVEEALEQMGHLKDWAALARSLRRILEGERDVQCLSQGLDEVDRQALALVLAALQDKQAYAVLGALAVGALRDMAAGSST